MASIGFADYRNGSKERLSEAFVLLREGRLGGCVYIAGRAVEGMLRAVIWKSDADYATGRKSLQTGHDLRDMLKLVRNLGVLRDRDLRDSLIVDVQQVGRLWWNNLRFLPTARVEKVWHSLGEVSGRRTMKQAAEDYYDACSAIIRRCEVLWHK